ncbi:outer membrane beta-barrel protein [Ornithobacterium rhinotracheale]|uniref:Uncharacterized protein n=1 Tax=Ornithobacterium rhinotracheale (strain ATCC 51463 / DSM 15997 / CCUG 23171 / CIP 104009 / LMG 9086) TaxID=867902 RepID=I3ZZ47_ORNRL|nr:outer membrane beta-barrel protein [Ornithobacterium rhinotracheale]AFL96981.1 hypothetical protein Ornrh_0784 [Ornithobacterium rhinotracheale DSM 15997]AIP99126.1 hypothetical protein Q785_04470 [Ornithobacterium rhinotracheale ORT-UMN 88]KGB67358.1 hypothetical protein Q787_04340 [Ornithobacterium rhinotracheale H06-030791]MCK0194502.1 outer membrane beta-barrel protein [Ornithobacterium rhinotracheale]MCK0202756.1 outer membrane beta-barrel protein [Ornithobacterium rhinotracheale]
MKKLFLLVIVAVASIANAQVGNFKIGGNVALPIGIFGDAYTFSVGADVAYSFNVVPNLGLGITTGYQHHFGKKTEKAVVCGNSTYTEETKSIGIIPLAGLVKYNVTPELFVGADLGAAFVTGGGESITAFYYQPKIGYQVNQHEIALGYRGLNKNNESVGAISLGYAYNF